MLRVARELLGESQDDVAIATSTSKRGIQRAEAEPPALALHDRLVEYFEKRGLQFSPPEDGHGWSLTDATSLGAQEEPPRLFRAARVGINRSQEKLGAEAALGLMTIRRIESGAKTVQTETRLFLIEHLKLHGVRFLAPQGAKGWGVVWASISDEATARHPRRNVQRRKRDSSPR